MRASADICFFFFTISYLYHVKSSKTVQHARVSINESHVLLYKALVMKEGEQVGVLRLFER